MPLNFHEQKCNFDIADCKYTDQRCSFFVLLQFDVHFVGFGWGNFKILPPCLYNYLRKVHFTGFNGIKGQREFLLHIVENAPALKVLTIDPKKKLCPCNYKPSDSLACRALCNCKPSDFLARRAKGPVWDRDMQNRDAFKRNAARSSFSRFFSRTRLSNARWPQPVWQDFSAFFAQKHRRRGPKQAKVRSELKGKLSPGTEVNIL